MPQTFDKERYTKFGEVANTTQFKQFRENITNKMDDAFPAIAEDLTDVYSQLQNISIPDVTPAEKQTVDFTEATTKGNIASGETIGALFGKIAKWFSSFGDLAWKNETDLEYTASGGAADSADKLNTNAGDTSTPVYFEDGIPKVCTSLDLNTTGNAASATTLSGTLPIEKGGTGATDAATARTNLGITAGNIGVYTKAEVNAAIKAAIDAIPLYNGE